MQDHQALEILEPGAISLHRHRGAYATLVRSGAYHEAAIGGRVRITAATLVVHPRFHLHSDIVFEPGAVWNIALNGYQPETWQALAGAPVERLANLDRKPNAEEVLECLGDSDPIAPERAADWLTDFTALPVRKFSQAQRAVSREHAHRAFKRHFGMSPGRYRRERNLQAAMRQIRAGGTLADVACAAGFTDQAHMTRVFKQELAMTPGVFRDQVTPVQ